MKRSDDLKGERLFNVIDYIAITSLGNATDFGDLTQSKFHSGTCSSSTRGVFGGGWTPTRVNTIDYITIATIGNALDFGDMTIASEGIGALSNSHGGLLTS